MHLERNNIMSLKLWMCTLICSLALVAGCKKQANDQDAIRAAIDKHLSEQAGLDLSAMDRTVKQVTVNGDHADAQMEFRVKGGGAGMVVAYSMEKQGGDWKVLRAQPMGGAQAHPGSESPSGAPGSGKNAMPQGHPPVN
jgi:hypothetical protein